MPWRPGTLCRKPGCGSIVNPRVGWCPAHLEEHRQALEARRRATRDRRLYDSAQWKKLRRRVLREEPYCRNGDGRRTTQVDHIVAVQAGGAPLDRDNLQGLCSSCHSRKTATEDGRWGARRG